MGIFSALLTFMIIIFGEIIPKTSGENYSLSISLICAKPISLLTKLLLPVVWIIEKVTHKFINKKVEFFTNEGEIIAMADIGHQEGSIEQEESDLIHKIFELNDVTAEQIMTPRIAVTFLNIDKTLSEVKEFIMNSQHSRIVAIKESIDEVKGFFLKDELLTAIINNKSNEKISNFLHEATFVMEAHKVNNLLKHFKETKQHIAIVVDEYGGVSGVVSLEDVLEELTGEIVDETDRVTDMQAYAKKLRKSRLKS